MTNLIKPASKHVLLAVTGSIGAKDTVSLCGLMSRDHQVRVVASTPALSFFNRMEVEKFAQVFTDTDDWYTWKQRGDEILHIALRNWADILVVAPMTANTLAKFVSGICDNLVTTVFRAWQIRTKSVLTAPSMNKFMWEHPLTAEHLATLADWGVGIIQPRSKLLAGGDIGPAAMATPETIALHVTNCTSNSPPSS